MEKIMRKKIIFIVALIFTPAILVTSLFAIANNEVTLTSGINLEDVDISRLDLEINSFENIIPVRGICAYS
jgi:hypothetical protein